MVKWDSHKFYGYPQQSLKREDNPRSIGPSETVEVGCNVRRGRVTK